MTDFKSSKLKSSKRVDASIARVPPLHRPSQNREEHFVPRALSASHPLLWRLSGFTCFSHCPSRPFAPLCLSLSLPIPLPASLSIFDDIQPRRVLFYSRSDFSRPIPIQQTSVLANGPPAPCSIAVFRNTSLSRIPACATGYRSHRQHVRKHVFEPCIPVKTNNFITSSPAPLGSKRSHLFLTRPFGLYPPRLHGNRAAVSIDRVRALL